MIGILGLGALYVHLRGVRVSTGSSLLPLLGWQRGVVDDSFIAARRQIGALTPDDERLLRRQREAVGELARRHVGTTLTGRSEDDLRVLQQVLNAARLEADQTFELQALGVALGDVMAYQLGLEWVVVEDRRGRSRALRFRDTENFVFPVTMISKRVEEGVPFRVRELYEKTRRRVHEFEDAARPGPRRAL